ncbi:regulation of nuclear pre-mRNA domain-containing protein 1B-like, partial [Scleropages formosus]
TLSLWIIHHRKHSALIVRVWHRELKRAKTSRKLTFLYLANDVIQNSKRKGPEFTRDFEMVLVDACSHVAREADEGCKKHMERLLNIWQERGVYRPDFIQQLKLAIEDSNSPKRKHSGKRLERTEELIKALQDLENAASGDAAVRQKIASLPQEVQDVSLLEKITDKEAADKLSKTEYKQKLARVTQVRKELKSHIQSLPDLSLLPN